MNQLATIPSPPPPATKRDTFVSEFALDRAGNLAQIYQGQWEAWEAYRQANEATWTYAEHQSWAEAHGRMTALVRLLGIYRRHDAGQLINDEDDYPPTSPRRPRLPDPDLADMPGYLQESFITEGGEQREEGALS